MGPMRVELVHALSGRQEVLSLDLQEGATVRDAVRAAGLRAPHAVGIFGRVVAPGARLHEGDRVEIYRPLLADPKEVRRRRASVTRRKR